MSWSFQCIGKPEALVKALEENSEKLADQSKIEYDEALPHLTALVKQNFAKEGSGYAEQIIDFEASGSGSSRGGEQVQRSCAVSIKPVWKKVVM